MWPLAGLAEVQKNPEARDAEQRGGDVRAQPLFLKGSQIKRDHASQQLAAAYYSCVRTSFASQLPTMVDRSPLPANPATRGFEAGAPVSRSTSKTPRAGWRGVLLLIGTRIADRQAFSVRLPLCCMGRSPGIS